MKSIIVLTMLILSGCATVMNEHQSEVYIKTAPNDAKFDVYNSEGRLVETAMSPKIVTLKTSTGSYFGGETYTLKFQKPGYEPVTRTLDSDVSLWYFGNIIFGGFIGMLIIDPLTGAMWELPKHMDVQLRKK